MRSSRNVFDAWLPDAVQTALLHACLADGTRSQAAFSEWRARTGGTPEALASPITGSRHLAPLLAHMAERCGMELGGPLAAYVHAARLRETRRWAAYRDVAATVLATARLQGVRVVALKGLALSETVYPSPDLRHSRDIDLLLALEDIPPASRALQDAGFQLEPGVEDEWRRGRHLMHSSGLPVVLHRGLFWVPSYDGLTRGTLERAVTDGRVEGASLPPAEDLFLHLCVHASTGAHRETLVWAADAWFLLRAHEIDWEVVVARATAHRMTVPLTVACRYLRERLGARIPESVVDRLAERANARPRLEREIAMRGAWSGRNSGVKRLLQSDLSAKVRARILMFKLVPSGAYLCMFEGARWWSLPWHYPRRWLRAIKRRFVARLVPAHM